MKRESTLLITVLTSLTLILTITPTLSHAKKGETTVFDPLDDWFDLYTGKPATGLDWLDIRKASMHKVGDFLRLSIKVKTKIPVHQDRENWAAYWWNFDTDENPETGHVLKYLCGDYFGIDYGVRVKYFYETDTWTAVLFVYDADGNGDAGTTLEHFYINGKKVVIWLPLDMIGDDVTFYWFLNTYDYARGINGGDSDKAPNSWYAEYN